MSDVCRSVRWSHFRHCWSDCHHHQGSRHHHQVYFSKVYFCEMYPTCASSKLCEFIILKNTLNCIISWSEAMLGSLPACCCRLFEAMHGIDGWVMPCTSTPADAFGRLNTKSNKEHSTLGLSSYLILSPSGCLHTSPIGSSSYLGYTQWVCRGIGMADPLIERLQGISKSVPGLGRRWSSRLPCCVFCICLLT